MDLWVFKLHCLEMQQPCAADVNTPLQMLSLNIKSQQLNTLTQANTTLDSLFSISLTQTDGIPH